MGYDVHLSGFVRLGIGSGHVLHGFGYGEVVHARKIGP